MRGIGDNSRPSNVFQVSRDIFDHPIVGAGNGGVDPWSRMEAWEWLLATARYKPGEISIRGEIVTIEIGQLVTTFAGLAQRWKWTVQRVRTFMGKLQDGGMIERKTNMLDNSPKGAHASVVTICNYGIYQFLEDYLSQQQQQPNQQPINTPATAQQQHKKKEEESNNNIKISARTHEGPSQPWSKKDPFQLNRWQAKAQEDVWFDDEGMLQVANGFKADLENILEDPAKLRPALNKAAGWVGVGEPPAQLKIKVRAQIQKQTDDASEQRNRFEQRYGPPPAKSVREDDLLKRPQGYPDHLWQQRLKQLVKDGKVTREEASVAGMI